MGELISGTLNGASDMDYYKFTTPSRGYFEVTINHDYNGETIYAEIYTYDGTESERIQFIYITETQQTQKGIKYPCKPGTFYLLVDAGSLSYFSQNEDYSIKVNFVPTDSWETESNENVVEATNIALNTKTFGVLYEHDKDVYKFTLPSNSDIKIDFAHGYDSEGKGMDLFSYDGTEEKFINRLSINSESHNTSSGNITLSAGTYYIRVFTYTNYHVGGEYNFSINTVGNSTPSRTITTTKKPPQTPTNNNPTNSNPTTPSTEPSTYVEITSVETENNGDIIVYNNFQYIIYNYTIVICGYVGSDVTVVIPSEIDGIKVTGIAENTFAHTTVQVINVPPTVYQFGKNAFGELDGEKRTIQGEEGSAAEKYAKEHNIEFESVYPPVEVQSADSNSAVNSNNDNKSMTIIIVLIVVVVILAGGMIVLALRKKKNNN